ENRHIKEGNWIRILPSDHAEVEPKHSKDSNYPNEHSPETVLCGTHGTAAHPDFTSNKRRTQDDQGNPHPTGTRDLLDIPRDMSSKGDRTSRHHSVQYKLNSESPPFRGAKVEIAPVD